MPAYKTGSLAQAVDLSASSRGPRPAARLTPPRPRRGAAYQLLEHNCNHFTDEVAQFLCGARVPKHIVRQPDTDLPPALRAALTELLAGAGQVPRGADPPYL